MEAPAQDRDDRIWLELDTNLKVLIFIGPDGMKSGPRCHRYRGAIGAFL